MFGQLLKKLETSELTSLSLFVLTFLTSTLSLVYNNQTLPTHPTFVSSNKIRTDFNFEGRDRGGRRDLGTFGPAACATEGPGAVHYKKDELFSRIVLKRGFVNCFREEKNHEKSDLKLKLC